MKRLGIRRTIDDVGRVTIPTELRKEQGFEKGVEVEFFSEGSDIVITLAKHRDRCVICGEPTDQKHRGKAICYTCQNEIRQKDEIMD